MRRMRRLPKLWPIGLREPKFRRGARNTCAGRMVGQPEGLQLRDCSRAVALRLPVGVRGGCPQDLSCETGISESGPTRAICPVLGSFGGSFPRTRFIVVITESNAGLLLSSLQHQVRRVLGGLVLRYRKS